MKSETQIDQIMEAIPEDCRTRWCGGEYGDCACMGNESGLSDNAIEKLIEIEKAANAIVQTWGDLKYKTKKIKRKVTIRNEKFHQ